MFCSKCGVNLHKDSHYCYKCGYKIIIPNKHEETVVAKVEAEDEKTSKPKDVIRLPAPTGPSGFFINILLFLVWLVAAFCFMFAVNQLFSRNFSAAIGLASASIIVWIIGIIIQQPDKYLPSKSKIITGFVFSGLLAVFSIYFIVVGGTFGFAITGLIIAFLTFVVNLAELDAYKTEPSVILNALLLSQPDLIIHTDNEEAQIIILQGRNYIQELIRLESKIQDSEVCNQIIQLKTMSSQIIDFVDSHPTHAGKLDRFMNYYFPTALRFLENYAIFSNKPVKGSNVQEALEKTSQGLLNIEKAFEQLLNNLYADKVIDIDSELAVLQHTMNFEGIGLDNQTGFSYSDNENSSEESD
ncbi:MAG: 5-bromo-4-chloroindolyl phosphate hydrolysis family protein [Defluviitaleaceae bacterium]|nr:5-bromo-4-chloroindolyl phosphate hydrolysis family protein [Defluviitaleaceae bacterium]